MTYDYLKKQCYQEELTDDIIRPMQLKKSKNLYSISMTKILITYWRKNIYMLIYCKKG